MNINIPIGGVQTNPVATAVDIALCCNPASISIVIVFHFQIENRINAVVVIPPSVVIPDTDFGIDRGGQVFRQINRDLAAGTFTVNRICMER